MKDLGEFKDSLLSTTTDIERLNFVRKYFFHGIPYVFNGREYEYFEFRDRISQNFEINFHEVFIVGSAKFGFSFIKETEFSYDSDIDVVLVNEKLFDYYYEKICDYQYEMDINHRHISLEEKKDYANFLRYLVKGWMRPDLLPISFQAGYLKKEWFDFFKSISNNKSEVGNYKVAGGLYRNYKYLEKYYITNINGYYNQFKFGRGE